MYVKQIAEVKEQMDQLKNNGLIEKWELPYENLLTRLNAAIFFVTPVGEAEASRVWKELEKFDQFSFRINREKKLSSLKYRITFNEEEKEKNLAETNEDASAVH
jgi:hypothetical protein